VPSPNFSQSLAHRRSIFVNGLLLDGSERRAAFQDPSILADASRCSAAAHVQMGRPMISAAIKMLDGYCTLPTYYSVG